MGITVIVDDFLQRAVLLRGLQIGRVVDVILGSDGENPVGFEVRCEDGRHRFLPAAVATAVDAALAIDSPFALLDTDELGFYRKRGLTLRTRSEPAA